MLYAISKKQFFLGFCLFLTSALPIYGEEPDTLFIRPVTIKTSRIQHYSEDIKTRIIDSTILVENSALNLGELLIRNTHLTITSYGGSNSVSSISLRGTGSNHTLITWNGFPINSLTTGGADLSLVPVGFFEEIQITYGTSGSLYGNSSIGGSIQLENRPDWSNRISGSFSAGLGSFGYQKYGARFTVGNDKVQYRMNGFYNSSRDDFPYIDTQKSGQPETKLKHNKSQIFSFLQDITIKLPENNFISLGLWYFHKEKEIPEIMGSYGISNQEQTDSLLKTYIKWNRRTDRSMLTLKSAYLMDNMQYTDKLHPDDEDYIINSKIKSNRILNDLSYRFYINRIFSFDLGGSYSYLGVTTNNYSGKKNESQGDLFAGMKFIHKRAVGNLTLRKTFTAYKDPGIMYSLGLKTATRSNRLTGRINISNKYRIPSFNEKYWQPGGNPDLKPEEGWGINVGTDLELWKFPMETGMTKLIIDFYSLQIDNWIQWIPSEINGIWSPENYRRVWSRGFETTLELKKAWLNSEFCMILGYAFTRSTNENASDGVKGNQLRYVPFHAGSGTIQFRIEKINIMLSNQFTGSRYSTDENTPSGKLDPFMINNLQVGIKLGKKDSVSLQARINNLLNKTYSIIRSYPMPGRGYYLNLIINLNKKSKTN